MQEISLDLFRAMGVENPERYLAQGTQPITADPVTENTAAMLGSPLAAAPHQNHDAHITVHASVLNNPAYAENVAMRQVVMAHVNEHLGHKFRIEIVQLMGDPQLQQAVMSGQPLPPELENQVALAAANVADKLVELDAVKAQIMAGEHEDPDLRVADGREGIGNAGARRIEHRDQPGKDEILLRLVQREFCLAGREIPIGEGDHAERLPAEGFDLRQDIGAQRIIERDRPAVQMDASAGGKDAFGRSLHVADNLAFVGAQHGHSLAPAVERQFLQQGKPGKAFFGIEPRLDGEGHEGGLRRIAHGVPARMLIVGRMRAAIAGEQAMLEELLDLFDLVRRDGGAILQDRSFRVIALPGHLEGASVGPAAHDGHLVGGDGACLVGANHGGAAERLHRRKALDDRGLAREPSDTERQRHGDLRRQSLRHAGRGNADGEQQAGVDQRLDIRKGIGPQQDVRREQGDYDHARDLGEGPRQGVDLKLERRAVAGDRLADLRDVADGRGHAAGEHDSGGAAARDGGSQEGQAVLIGQRRLAVEDQRRILLLRHGLAGEGEIVGGELMALDQPDVGRHGVAGFQKHDIPRHEVAFLDLAADAVADDPRARQYQLLEPFEEPLCLVFLVESYDCVDQDDGDKNRSSAQIVEVIGKRGGDEQQADKQIVELVQEHAVDGPTAGLLEHVGAELPASTPDFGRRQSGFGIALQLMDDVGRGEPVGSGVEGWFIPHFPSELDL